MAKPSIDNRVSLKTLAGGTVIDRFDYELAKVIGNIRDINTSTKKLRKVHLTLAIAPDEERNFGEVSIVCKSDLAPVKEIPTKFYLGEIEGQAVAFESNPNQTHFGFDSEPSYENVTEIEREKVNEH